MNLEQYVLPSDWQMKPLASIHAGSLGTINPANYPAEVFEYYSIPAYQENQQPTVARGGEIGSLKLILTPGTVLFGKLNPRVEKAWRVGNYTANRKIGSTEWIPIIPQSGVAEEFLYFLMWSEHVMSVAKGLVSGSTPSRQRVDPRSFYRIKVPIPPLAEQRKIAVVLGTVQRSIEEQERLLRLTTELKKSLLQKLFTEGLRGEPQKMTEIGPVPESWEVVPLAGCATVQTGIAKGRTLDGQDTITLPYLRVANVQAGFLDLSEMKTITIRTREKPRYLLRPGDVVLTEGGDFDKLGRGFIWKGEIEECVHQNHIFAVRVDQIHVLPRFFAHLSQSPYGRAYFLSVAHKTTNLACINTTKLKGFPVLIPPKAEQEEIVQMLECVDGKLDTQARKAKMLSDLFRTLLHQLMTAQIRVHDLDRCDLQGTIEKEVDM